MRIGQGFDAHRFDGESGPCLIRLGGVDIPHEHEVVAHSDGDVIVHALMDAMLGAMSLGDIGRLFPDNDARYRDADSLQLLDVVRERVAEMGYHLVNADITLVAERPRVAAYRSEMTERIARCLMIEPSCVSVKATTTEGMGFVGREEGLAAMAVVLMDSG